MRMAGRVSSCCAALFLTLTTVSAFQKLNSINDLKKINFGQSVPRHSLLLLHWFANVVDIDRNNVMHLTFDPDSEDYGSHHYGNFDELLDPLPYRHRYFTVGNLNPNTAQQLPDYVIHPPAAYAGTNSDRIIFRVREQNTDLPTIDRVYLTQHYGTYGTANYRRYDPAYTYEITTNLLREIREFSVEENQPLWDLRNRFGSNASEFQLEDIRNTCSDLACLGLLLFIVIQEGYWSNKVNYRPLRNQFIYRPQSNPVNSTPQHNPVNSTPQHNPVNYTPQHNPVNYSNLQAARNTDSDDFFFWICVLFIFLIVIVLGIWSPGKKR